LQMFHIRSIMRLQNLNVWSVNPPISKGSYNVN
jgi:hypothetical protein